MDDSGRIAPATLPAVETVSWPAAIAAMACISIAGIGLGLGAPLLSVLLEQRGYSATLIGINTAIGGVGSVLCAPLATPLAMRLGAANTMIGAALLGGASFVGFYFTQDYAVWLGLRFALHFALTLLFILSEFWIASSAPPSRRGFVLGIYATVLSLGFAAGPMLFAVLGSAGFAPFGAGIALMLLALIPIVLARALSPDLTRSDDSHPGFWRYVWLVPTATAAVFVFGAVETAGFSLLPVHGAAIGYSETEAALLLSMVGLGNVVMQVPLGYWSDRIGDRRRLLALCAGIGLAGMLAMPMIQQNWWAVAAMLFVWGGVVAGLYTIGLAHLGASLAGAELAAANSAFVACYSFGMLLGPFGIGAGMDVFGDAGFSSTIAAFFGAYLVLVLWRIARK